MGGTQNKMAIFDLPNATDGMDSIIIDVVSAVPMFSNMLLAFMFALIFLGGTSQQLKRTGFSDLPFWAVTAGMVTTLFATLFSIIGLVNIQTMGVVIGITLLSGIWFLMSKGRGEV